MKKIRKEIAEFYKKIFSDAVLKNRVQEKAKKIVTEADLRKLIREDIVPLMKKEKLNCSEDELLEYEEETLKKLSEEALKGVNGGISFKSALITGGVLSMALFGGGTLADQNVTSAQVDPPTAQSTSTSETHVETQKKPYVPFRKHFIFVKNQVMNILDFLGQNRTKDEILNFLRGLDAETLQTLATDANHLMPQIRNLEGWGLYLYGTHLADFSVPSNELRIVKNLPQYISTVENERNQVSINSVTEEGQDTAAGTQVEGKNELAQEIVIASQDEEVNNEVSASGTDEKESEAESKKENKDNEGKAEDDNGSKRKDDNEITTSDDDINNNGNDDYDDDSQYEEEKDDNRREKKDDNETTTSDDEINNDSNDDYDDDSQYEEEKGEKGRKWKDDKTTTSDDEINNGNNDDDDGDSQYEEEKDKKGNKRKDDDETSTSDDNINNDDDNDANNNTENRDLYFDEESKEATIFTDEGMKNFADMYDKLDYNCHKVVLGNKITSIPSGAFSSCSGINYIIIPASVTSIENDAFYGCSSLRKIKVDKNNPNFCDIDGVLYRKNEDRSLTLLRCPINYQALDYMFEIKDGVTSIGPKAFGSCRKIHEITIPSSITSIENDAFYGCSNLREFNVDKNNPNFCDIDGVLYRKNEDRSLTLLRCPINYQTRNCMFEIKDGVTSIEPNAFERCDNFNEIKIPSSITSIGEGAFNNCNIKAVKFFGNNDPDPEGKSSMPTVYRQQMSYFENKIEPIKVFVPYKYSSKLFCGVPVVNDAISDGLTFNEIDGILTIHTNEAIQTWKKFVSEYKVKEVFLSDQVTLIPPKAFQMCQKLTKVFMQSSITSIGDYAFCDCTSLVQIELPDSVISIGDFALYNCNLTQINIPPKVSSIGKDAFAVNSLTQINIPSNVNFIGRNAFGHDHLEQINVDENNKNYKSVNGALLSKNGEVFICCPSNYKNNVFNIPNGVKIITDYAFDDCINLTQINLPPSVTYIGKSAFERCSKLTQINIPANVTSIGESAFRGCDSLAQVSIPASVTYIGNSAFDFTCSKLKEITVDENNTNFCDVEGALCKKNEDKTLTLIRCPAGKVNYSVPSNCDNLASIASSAFFRCKEIKRIDMQEAQDVTLIPQEAFGRCSNLIRINLPPNTKSIEKNAFSYCEKLERINIPTKVTSIGEEAFRDCKSLTSIEIPDKVTSIGKMAFEDCQNLKKINIPIELTKIEDKTFFKCKSLEKIDITSKVTSIGEEAFEDCCSLTSVAIPESVVVIGRDAFNNCTKLVCVELNNIKGPVNINDIRNLMAESFRGCSNVSVFVANEKINL